MTRRGLIPGIILLLALLARPAPGADLRGDDLTDEHVRAAIAAITDALYALHDDRHHWDPPKWDAQRHGSKYQVGGYTALAVLALLHAGESYQDPRLRGAVEALATDTMEGTYAVALRAAVWAKLPPRFRENLERDVQWLLDGFSARVVGWAYDQDPRTSRQDNSIRQYVALALWDAHRRGVDVDARCWRRLEQAFLDGQLDDGAWAYLDGAGDPTPRGSMTAAGLTVLHILEDVLHAEEAVRLGNARPERVERARSRGLAWLDANFSAVDTPGKPDYYYFYYIYGIERVGLASGRRILGGEDWFRAGAAEIIRRLCRWDEATGAMTIAPAGNRLDSTMVRQLSFGLMFLSRGRVPIAVNKLEIAGADWNNRPRDAANLARHLTAATEGELNWQIVSADAAPETWLDAPLLYLASHRPLPWRGADEDDETVGPEAAKLKRYLERGGMLLAVNEGNGRAFAESVERLATRLRPDGEWRDLPDDHWAYTLHAKVTRGAPPLRGFTNGVRELIVLAPSGDLAAKLQVPDERRSATIDTATNVYLYASAMNQARPRLAAPPPPLDGFTASGRGAVVVRARHGGNWNPEPLALEALRAHLAADGDLALRIVDHDLETLDDVEPRPDLVVVQDTAAHAFTALEREAIRRYVAGGGVILFESPGGGAAFTESLEPLFARLFPDAPLRPLRRHPIVTGADLEGGEDASRVSYRLYSRERFGGRERAPRLRGIEVDGAVRIVVSREDLSHALLDQPVWGVDGYLPADAQRLLANLLRYGSATR